MIDLPIGRVAAAYASQGTAAAGPAAPTTAVNDPARAETGFGDFLDAQAAEAVRTLQHGEAMQAAAMTGKASAQEVVRAVLAAEMTVQTVVAVRDRMVMAYQDIMRMAV